MTSALTKWENYAPYGIGLDDFFNRLDRMHNSKVSFPPYNIVKQNEDNFYIELAVAGYSRDNLEVYVEKRVLTVTGKSEEDNVQYTYRGIAQRTFTRSWNLGEDVIVDSVTYNDGMLRIYLRREIPEEQRRKLLPIT